MSDTRYPCANDLLSAAIPIAIPIAIPAIIPIAGAVFITAIAAISRAQCGIVPLMAAMHACHVWLVGIPVAGEQRYTCAISAGWTHGSCRRHGDSLSSQSSRIDGEDILQAITGTLEVREQRVQRDVVACHAVKQAHRAPTRLQSSRNDCLPFRGRNAWSRSASV